MAEETTTTSLVCPECKLAFLEQNSFLAHVKTHIQQKDTRRAKASQQPEVKPEKLPFDPAKIKNAEERELYERALAAQEELRKVPNSFTELSSSDEHWELRKAYAPETIDEMNENGKVIRKAEKSAFIADGNRIDMYVARGYVPKFNERGEMVRTPHGDVLMTHDRKITDAFIAEAGKESRARLHQTTTKAGSYSTLKDGSGIATTTDGLKESLEISEEVLMGEREK